VDLLDSGAIRRRWIGFAFGHFIFRRLYNLQRGFMARDFYLDEVALQKLVLDPTHTDGKARFADAKDLNQSGMDKAGGLFLGSLNGKDIYYPN
jgi:hypothetical protein